MEGLPSPNTFFFFFFESLIPKTSSSESADDIYPLQKVLGRFSKFKPLFLMLRRMICEVNLFWWLQENIKDMQINLIKEMTFFFWLVQDPGI